MLPVTQTRDNRKLEPLDHYLVRASTQTISFGEITGEQLLVSIPQTIDIPQIKVNNGTRRNKCIALTLAIGLVVTISIIVGIIISMKSSSSGQEINSKFILRNMCSMDKKLLFYIFYNIHPHIFNVYFLR